MSHGWRCKHPKSHLHSLCETDIDYWDILSEFISRLIYVTAGLFYAFICFTSLALEGKHQRQSLYEVSLGGLLINRQIDKHRHTHTHTKGKNSQQNAVTLVCKIT